MNKHPDIIDVQIRDTQLILSDQLVELLKKQQTGDKVNIEYVELNNKIVPVIEMSDIGHKLNKNNTISFRGKQREVLGQFGTNFWATDCSGTITLEGDGLPIFTTVKKAVETYLTKNIIEDTNYSIKEIKNYEF